MTWAELTRLVKNIPLLVTGWLLVFGLATGAGAQGEALLVALTGTESQHFPQLTLYTTVSQSGHPLEKLTAKDFVIFENNLQTPIAPQTVEPISLKGLQVVLALDVSLPETDLAEVKTAAKSLVQTLAMEDRLALLSFGDGVKPNYTFTNNTTALTTAIDALQPEGEHTALHQTIVEAAWLLDPLPAGRKAIIIITDSYDNFGSPSLDYVLPWVQKARLPLFIIGFGGKVQGQHPLKAEVAVTGGAYLAVADAGVVNSTMLTLEKQLRQGYKITFNSSLPADNTIHEVFVRVTGPNGNSETAAGQFITTPGPVNLSPTGLTDGQTVTGPVNLGVTATAPAPLATVTYLLDNQVLAEVTTPPYSFVWDTATTGFGSHILTIKAVDRAGNTGTIPLNVTVEGSLKVNVFMPQTPIEIGQPVTPTVQIETAAGLASVDYLLNDQLLGRSTAPPYGFGFDTQAYSPGTYQMKVLVTDANGHTATAVTELELLPAGPPPPTWVEQLLQNRWFQLGVTVTLAVVALALIILLTIWLLRIIKLAQQKWVQRRASLELVNAGNISSRFGLGADAEKNLKFQFSLHGKSLPVLPVAQSDQVQPVAPAAKALPASRSRRSQSAVAGVEAVQGRIYGGLSSVMQILTTISQVLPGSAGAAVARVTQQISARYMPVDRLVRTQTQ